jgi:predicted dehydrogenase
MIYTEKQIKKIFKIKELRKIKQEVLSLKNDNASSFKSNNSLDFKNDLKIVSDNNIFFLEALMYLHHPQTKIILDIIRSNEIGKITNINFFIGFDMRRRVLKYFKKKIDFNSSRLTDPNLGGGAINDFACYGLTYAMLIAGAQNNSYFSIPTKLIAKGHVGITGVDENSVASLEFDNGIKANLLVSINKKQDNKLKIKLTNELRKNKRYYTS